jgi:hypothetical protein
VSLGRFLYADVNIHLWANMSQGGSNSYQKLDARQNTAENIVLGGGQVSEKGTWKQLRDWKMESVRLSQTVPDRIT